MAKSIRAAVTKEIFVDQRPGFDVILNIGDRKLYAPKSLLCMASPVFEKMLNAEETRAGEQHEIYLPKKKYEDVLLLLRCIHPGVPTCVEENNADVFLGLAREFNIEGIVESCRRIYLLVLSRVGIKESNWQDTVLKVMVYADKYGLEDVIQMGVSILYSSEWKSIKLKNTFLSMSIPTRFEVASTILDKMERESSSRR